MPTEGAATVTIRLLILWTAIALIAAETIFLGLLVLGWILLSEFKLA